MRRQWLGTIGFAAALLLMVPRAASAGFGEVVDIIIGLTGPQMVGAPIFCERNLQTNGMACFFAGKRYPGKTPEVNLEYWQSRNVWASFGGGVYASTWKDSDMSDFALGRIWALAFEPMLNFRTFKNEDEDVVIEHGVGPSGLFLFGKGPDPFARGAIKVRFIGVTKRDIIKGFDFGVAYNLRIFPKAFTSQDFNPDATTNTHSGREYAHGVTFTIGH